MVSQPTGGRRLLDGRVAVVTGAGQGVGRGIAVALSRAGASLLLVGRTAVLAATSLPSPFSSVRRYFSVNQVGTGWRSRPSVL